MPVIKALWEAKVGGSPEVRSLRPAWPTWQHPISNTNIKLARHGVHACNTSYSGSWGKRIAWTQEAEIAVSRHQAIALQPGQQEWNSVSKNVIIIPTLTFLSPIFTLLPIILICKIIYFSPFLLPSLLFKTSAYFTWAIARANLSPRFIPFKSSSILQPDDNIKM